MKNQMNEITDFRGEYYFLSNFYCGKPFQFNGLIFNNTEAAFQAQKCTDEVEKATFANLKPREAKIKGMKVNLIENWNEYRFFVMYSAIKAKFTQDPILKKKLLSTGASNLVEGNTWHDNEWGACICPRCKKAQENDSKNKPKNYLGHTLMQIRYELALKEDIIDLPYDSLISKLEGISNKSLELFIRDVNFRDAYGLFLSCNIDTGGRAYYIGAKVWELENSPVISIVTHRKRLPIIKWLNGDSIRNVYSKDIKNYLNHLKDSNASIDELMDLIADAEEDYLNIGFTDDEFKLNEFVHDEYLHFGDENGKKIVSLITCPQDIKTIARMELCESMIDSIR